MNKEQLSMFVNDWKKFDYESFLVEFSFKYTYFISITRLSRGLVGGQDSHTRYEKEKNAFCSFLDWYTYMRILCLQMSSDIYRHHLSSLLCLTNQYVTKIVHSYVTSTCSRHSISSSICLVMKNIGLYLYLENQRQDKVMMKFVKLLVVEINYQWIIFSIFPI
jgi:hypothetical protein